MDKILIKSLFLFVPFLLFAFYMEYKLSQIPNSYSFKRECFEKQLDSIEVLVLGSSQVAFGVNPEYFILKGFNLSNIAQSLYYDTHITLKYIDRMPKLKYVLINISYFSFGYQLIDGIEKWRDYSYYQFWDINFPEHERFDIKLYSKLFLYTPSTAMSYLAKGFHMNLIGGTNQNGYCKIDTVKNNFISDSLGYQRVKLHDKIDKEFRYKENQADLELLVGELKRRNIIPVIVTPPVYSTYSKFANKIKLKRINGIINSICIKYNFKNFDYFTDIRFVKSDFFDNDHLNFIGADKFSKIINNEILIKQ